MSAHLPDLNMQRRRGMFHDCLKLVSRPRKDVSVPFQAQKTRRQSNEASSTKQNKKLPNLMVSPSRESGSSMRAIPTVSSPPPASQDTDLDNPYSTPPLLASCVRASNFPARIPTNHFWAGHRSVPGDEGDSDKSVEIDCLRRNPVLLHRIHGGYDFSALQRGVDGIYHCGVRCDARRMDV